MTALALAAEPGSRAALYGRFSNKEQDGKAATLEDQFRDERARAEARGHVVVAEFADDGFSAFKRNVKRPGYDALLDLIESGGVDFVYTNRSDRTTRQNLQLEMILALCEERGVVLIEGGDVTDPSKDDDTDMRRMKGMFDRRYSSKVRENVTRARRLTAEKGLPHPGPRPFGWNDDKMTLHPTEGALYRELFERVIRGEGITKVALDWEQRGIVGPRSRVRFDTASLQKMIHAPRAIGMRQYRGEVVGPFADGFEPVVDEATQRAAIAAMGSRRTLRTTHSTKRRARLLSSMVRCGGCGNPLRARYSEHPTKKPEYGCNVAHGRNCGKCWVKAVPVEEHVVGDFLAALSDPKTLAKMNALRDAQPDVTKLLDAVTNLRAELDGLAAERGRGDITKTEYDTIRVGIAKRLKDAEAAAEKATDMPLLLTVNVLDVLNRWDSIDLDEKRRYLNAFIRAVEIKPAGRGNHREPIKDRVFIEWRI